MKLYRLLSFAAVCLLVTTSATRSDATFPRYSEDLLLPAMASENSVDVNAVLNGSEPYAVAWRLSVSEPSQLRFDSKIDAFVFQSQEGVKAILPSGDSVSPAGADPTKEFNPISAGLTVESHSLHYRSSDSRDPDWTYRLPEGQVPLPQTIQVDGLNRIYFQDDQSRYYSLDSNGKVRFLLSFESLPGIAECAVALNGDSICLSNSFGVIGIRQEIDAPRLMIDGREKFFPYPPQLVNGSVFIPFRNLFEALGATVRWDGKSRTVEALKGKRKVRLTIGKSTAEVNGKAVKIAQTPFVKNGATFIPLRLAGEALGYVVVWENATRTIQIVSS